MYQRLSSFQSNCKHRTAITTVLCRLYVYTLNEFCVEEIYYIFWIYHLGYSSTINTLTKNSNIIDDNCLKSKFAFANNMILLIPNSSWLIILLVTLHSMLRTKANISNVILTFFTQKIMKKKLSKTFMRNKISKLPGDQNIVWSIVIFDNKQ